MKKIGKEISAAQYWQSLGSIYAEDIGSNYHADLFGMIEGIVTLASFA